VPCNRTGAASTGRVADGVDAAVAVGVGGGDRGDGDADVASDADGALLTSPPSDGEGDTDGVTPPHAATSRTIAGSQARCSLELATTR
jgi:hypothetical protein